MRVFLVGFSRPARAQHRAGDSGAQTAASTAGPQPATRRAYAQDPRPGSEPGRGAVRTRRKLGRELEVPLALADPVAGTFDRAAGFPAELVDEQSGG